MLVSILALLRTRLLGKGRETTKCVCEMSNQALTNRQECFGTVIHPQCGLNRTHSLGTAIRCGVVRAWMVKLLMLSCFVPFCTIKILCSTTRLPQSKPVSCRLGVWFGSFGNGCCIRRVMMCTIRIPKVGFRAWHFPLRSRPLSMGTA